MAVSDAKKVEQAQVFGRQARDAGRRIGDCPYKGSTAVVRACAQAWQKGWRERDAERKARVGGAP